MNKSSQSGPVEITAAELNRYLEESSGFAFELQVLKRFNEMEFRCEHGGSYVDAITGKVRQFDIRARWERGRTQILCAVECKCLSRFAPLLILEVPRQIEDSYHEVVMAVNNETHRRTALPLSSAFELAGRHCAYRLNEPVGKSCAQVSMAKGEVTGKDSEIYDRWSQALSSAAELVEEAGKAPIGRDVMLTVILPILVVPDGMLWRVDFDVSGNKVKDPESTNRASYFVGHEYEGTTWPQKRSFRVSHLEIVTMSGLNSLLGDLWGSHSWFELPHHVRTAFGP